MKRVCFFSVFFCFLYFKSNAQLLRLDKCFSDANIYPNPAQDKIIIDLQKWNGEKVQLRVYDITGKIVQAQIISQQQTIIDVGYLAAGEYIFQAEMPEGIIANKIIIAK
jgi:hypothetical protein